MIENRFGKGRTLLVGTHPGVAYFKTSNAENLRYFADVFAWTGRTRNVTCDNPHIIARLHLGPEGGALWVVNSRREPQRARISLGGDHATLRISGAYWGESDGESIVVPPRDVLVLKLSA